MNDRVLLALFLMAPLLVSAQSDSTASKVSYFNSFHAGGLFGKKGNGSGESFATIHGIRVSNFAFGIGAGYDAYHDGRTLPVFASISYDFLKLRDNAFFVQLNAGYSKAWYPREAEDQFQFTYDHKGGPCAHPLLGYRIHSNKFELYLTAGYKFQAINFVQTASWWTPGSKINVGRDMERISIQFGFGFH